MNGHERPLRTSPTRSPTSPSLFCETPESHALHARADIVVDTTPTSSTMPPAKPKDTDTPQGPQPRRSNRQRGKQPDGSDNADLASLGRQAPASKDSDPVPKAQARKPTSPAKPAPSKAKNTRDGHDKERGNSVMPDQRPARPTPTQVTRKTLADVVRGSTSPSDRRPSLPGEPPRRRRVH